MMNSDGTFWFSDKELFAALPGGQSVIDWFGFVPSFHDAKLDRLDLINGEALIRLRVFRIADAVDDRGFFVLDKHALVTIYFSNVTGVNLRGDASSILSELGIRRVSDVPIGFSTCGGPDPDDIEVSFEASYGLEGSIYSREVKLSIQAVC